MELTSSQQTVLDQIIWLQAHFESKFGIEAFSQSNAQFESKLGLSRKTVQTAVRKLEELGIIEVARNAGFKGANLFFLHKEKLITSFESFTSKAREAFKKAMELGEKVSSFSVINTEKKEELRQFKGKYLTKAQAKASGFAWDVAVSPSEAFRQELIANGREVRF